MSRKDEIKSAYKNLGKASKGYDGMMSGKSAGKAFGDVCGSKGDECTEHRYISVQEVRMTKCF